MVSLRDWGGVLGRWRWREGSMGQLLEVDGSV